MYASCCILPPACRCTWRARSTSIPDPSWSFRLLPGSAGCCLAHHNIVARKILPMLSERKALRGGGNQQDVVQMDILASTDGESLLLLTDASLPCRVGGIVKRPSLRHGHCSSGPAERKVRMTRPCSPYRSTIGGWASALARLALSIVNYSACAFDKERAARFLPPRHCE